MKYPFNNIKRVVIYYSKLFQAINYHNQLWPFFRIRFPLCCMPML